MVLIDGKHIAHATLREAKKLRLLCPVQPTLGVILVGSDPASHAYVALKQKAAKQVGARCIIQKFPETATTREVAEAVETFNRDTSVHAILVQLPLPPSVDTPTIINTMTPHKDVDGFLDTTVAAYEGGNVRAMPVIVRSVDAIIREAMPMIAGKKVVILGNNPIFTRPLAHYFMSKQTSVAAIVPTPAIIPNVTQSADIIVTALGRIGALTSDAIADGTLIIDIGTTKNSDGMLCGDTDLASLDHRPLLITPVPGGVGPVTVACLIQRVMELALEQSVH